MVGPMYFQTLLYAYTISVITMILLRKNLKTGQVFKEHSHDLEISDQHSTWTSVCCISNEKFISLHQYEATFDDGHSLHYF